jgi:O-antigen/teichoic acid export membrane protein
VFQFTEAVQHMIRRRHSDGPDDDGGLVGLFAFVALGVWTILCLLAVWYVFQDEEIPYDPGAGAAAAALTLLIFIVWLGVSAFGILVARHMRKERRRPPDYL